MKKKQLELLAKANNVTETTVYNALSYKTESELAQSLRKQAVEKYGGIVTNKIVF